MLKPWKTTFFFERIRKEVYNRLCLEMRDSVLFAYYIFEVKIEGAIYRLSVVRVQTRIQSNNIRSCPSPPLHRGEEEKGRLIAG